MNVPLYSFSFAVYNLIMWCERDYRITFKIMLYTFDN